jgi:hypothetical protein
MAHYTKARFSIINDNNDMSNRFYNDLKNKSARNGQFHEPSY